MKSRPILFSGPMVCALLDGTKTQTRRIVKPQPSKEHRWGGFVMSSTVRSQEGKALWGTGEYLDQSHYVRCPYGLPGDRLWVRETTSESESCFLGGRAQPTVWYRADNNRPMWADRKWTPSILSPRRLSRITLEITEIRVQRLQEISEEDARAEGCATGDPYDNALIDPATDRVIQRFTDKADSARDSYYRLWDQINSDGSWDANPWVWCVSFRPPTHPTEPRND